MKKNPAAKRSGPDPVKSAVPPQPKVQPPTRKEILIAAFLAYIKLPLLFYPLAWVGGWMNNGFIELILAFLIAAFVLSAANTMAEDYVIRLRGQITLRHFLLLYLAGILLIVLSFLAMPAASGLKMPQSMFVVHLLRLVTMPSAGDQGVAPYACLIIAGGLWLMGVAGAHRQRCDSCGGYAYKEITDISEEHRNEMIGESTTNTSEVEEIRIDAHGYEERIRETTTTTKTYAYRGKERIACRYCGKVHGVRAYSGTYKDEEKLSDWYTERH